MPGEPLMCVWEAVLAKDNSPDNGSLKTSILLKVVESFKNIQNIRYSEKRFKVILKKPTVRFSEFFAYMSDNLRAPGVPLPLLIHDVESKCWEMAGDSYNSEILDQQDLFKIWTIFNRLCVVDSYPPVISKEQTNYLFKRVAQNVEMEWQSKENLAESGLTFQQMLHELEKTYFDQKVTLLVHQCIDIIHSWLVREVMKTGILYKRTRKSANWTNWQKRWFVMSPGRLEYYHHEKRRDKKGEVIIDTKTEIVALSDYKAVLSKLENRFKVSKFPSFEIEMCAETEKEKEEWIMTLTNNVTAMQNGITPQMELLKQREQFSGDSGSASLLHTDKELNAAALLARCTSVSEETTKTPTPGKARNGDVDDCNENEMYNTDLFEEQKAKLKAVFYSIDKDGNGKIDRQEFAAFIGGLGAHLDPKQINLLFDMIDKDRNQTIWFEEFIKYFMDFLLGKTTDTDLEAKLRVAFLKADRTGKGLINFSEFSEYAYSVRRSVAIDKVMDAFKELDTDGTGEIHYEEFKEFFKNEPAFLERSASIRYSQNIESRLKMICEEADTGHVATYLRDRWGKWASFKRFGEQGNLVMKGGHGMVDDIVPGHYTLIDLACFNDLPPIIPKHITVNVEWISSGLPGRSGRVVFPDDFDGMLPTEIATNEHLAYYGCSLADGNQLQVSLLYRHGIQDFTYENTYLEDYVTSEKAMGGAGMEHHDFSHLDCPLEENSGFFIIGKFADDLLHLTAFKVPTRHTLYVPGGVIHSNDYLKGTWRTMLSDEAEADHVQLVKVKKEQNGDEQVIYFPFSFKPLFGGIFV